MARSKKPKGYGTRPGSPSRVRQAGVKQASAAANTGMVWPVPYPKAHATALAMQFKFQASEWWSSDRLLANQLRQVDCLLRHALKTVPYYREKFRGQPAVSGAPLTVEEFRQLPLLQRMDIQTAGKALVSKALPESHGKAFEVKSSGSTGRPIQVLGTDLTNMYVAALTMRGHLWHRRDGTCRNVDIRTAKAAGARRQSVWMPVPDAGKSIRLDINSPIDKLLDQLVVEDPVYLQTHPHTLMGLIEDSTARGLLPRSLREARTFGEALAPHIRAAARQHWGIDVVDNYSAMETGTVAHQCPESENLHVQAESVLVEVLRDDDTPCQAGEVGRVVITSLHNFATPLIRYEIGDRAEVGEACGCGRGLPVLTRIVGRERNFLVLPTGEKRFPEARYMLMEVAPQIRQFQIIQKVPEKMEIKLVIDEPLTRQAIDRLTQTMNDKFGYPFEYEFFYADDIPRAPNGKFEEFKSEVSQSPERHS
jgi:phenylacetate-CoA ligase